MKVSKRVRTGYALALAGMLVLPGLNILRTQAAGEIDTEAVCSLTVSVEDSEYSENFNGMKIPVEVYKVADVDRVGKYTAEEDFSELDFGQISSETTAQEWLELADKADAVRREKKTEASGKVTVEKKEEGMEPAKGTFHDLSTGMYLVVPEDTFNADYSLKYVFSPYLTALPGNKYASSDNYGTGSDEWSYDPVIGLKAAEEPQEGSITITKKLSDYNETLGRTSFVFEITGRDKSGAVVYRNVASTTHDGPGSESVTIDGIPAGAVVTVKEIYGGSYIIEGDDTVVTVVTSDEAVDAGDAEEAFAEFTNKYNGNNRGGYGVTNKFDLDGKSGWTWKNPTEETPQKMIRKGVVARMSIWNRYTGRISGNKRTILMSAAALGMTAALTLQSSMAYFTTYVSAGGSRPVSLGAQTEMHEDVSDMTKHITISNTSEVNDCFVRVKAFYAETFDVSYTDVEGKGDWKQGEDNYWYYSKVLKPGEETSMLDAHITVSEGFDADSFNVVVIQECIPAVYDDEGNPDWDQMISDYVKKEADRS